MNEQPKEDMNRQNSDAVLSKATSEMAALGPYDVLLGRGTGPNENQGNKFYRDMLRKYKMEYRMANSRKEKKAVVLKALEEVKVKGGRFLEKTRYMKEKKGGEHFKEVDDSVAFLKTRQAFRYILQGGGSNKKGDSTEGTSDEVESSAIASSLPVTYPQHAVQSAQGMARLALAQELSTQRAMQDLSAASPLMQRLALTPLVSTLHMSPYLPSSGVGSQRSSLLSVPDTLFAPGLMPGQSSSLQAALLSHQKASSMLGGSSGVSGAHGLDRSDLLALSATPSPFGSRSIISESDLQRRLGRIDPVAFSRSPSAISRAAITEQLLLQRAMQRRREEAARITLSSVLAPNLQALKSQQKSSLEKEEVGKGEDTGTKKDAVPKNKNLHQIMAALPGDRNAFLSETAK